jgi:broad specificity phosphatase PhoE
VNNVIEETYMNMKKLIARKAFPVVSAVFFAAVAIGCGDDSSKSSPAAPDDQVPGSSASVDTTTPTDQTISSASDSDSAANPGTDPATNPDAGSNPNDSSNTETQNPGTDPGSSTVIDNPVAQSAINRDPAVAGLTLAADTNGFYDVGDIYKAVPAESKIVFVLRHAERESGLGKESPLTEVGVQQALDVGAKLASDESFYFGSTDFLRTRTTAENIAKGHGEASVTVDTLSIINGGYFLTVPSDTLDALVSKRGGNFLYVSQWAYGVPFTNNYAVQHGVATYFYDLFERGDQFINEVILANLPNWKRVSVLITHDLLTEPLAVYASNRMVDLKTYESYRWINYVAGIAVVINANGLVTVLPARGVDVGFLNTKDAY